MRRNLSERDNVVSESIGKRIGDHVYFHVSALTAHHRSLVEQASQVAELREENEFNVVKLYEQGDELSLLHYPKFFEDAFSDTNSQLEDLAIAQDSGLSNVSRIAKSSNTPPQGAAAAT